VALSGAVLSYGGSIVGYFSLLIGLLSMIGIFISALRNWDYQEQSLRATRLIRAASLRAHS